MCVTRAMTADATTETSPISRRRRLDPAVVLPRGEPGSFDSHVVGDPCVVWDDDVGTWRMFYFAAREDDICSSACALADSAEAIGPGAWHKQGSVNLANPDALLKPTGWHKWWVATDAARPNRPNRAARLDGRFWAFFATTRPRKVIQAAWAECLAGPWRVQAGAIIEPGERDAPDGLWCDTPTACVLNGDDELVLFYKAYPARPQAGQPGAPFGSCSVAARWRPDAPRAGKIGPILRPGNDGHAWTRGWIGGVQPVPHEVGWIGLLNASPTPPDADSHREPAPSQGGWAVHEGGNIETGWRVDDTTGPIFSVNGLCETEREAGLGVNFWRHHLLVTPSGRERIFFNSGAYGREQMYSCALRNEGI